FCFNLVAMVLLVETGFWSERTAVYLRVAAGCSLAISVLSKQSAGVVLLPVPLGVVVITCLTGRRQILGPLLQVSAGVLLVAAVFVLWLWSVSSLTGFWRSVVVTSRVLAGARIGRVISVTDLLLLGQTLPFVRVALLAFFVFAISRGAFSR